MKVALGRGNQRQSPRADWQLQAASGLKNKSWLITYDIQAKVAELLKGYWNGSSIGS